MSDLYIHNSLSREKEKFVSIIPKRVGLYVCGPTVNGESHLGHARPYVTFDVVRRWLRHLGYQVRYVRNITDAGHFEENDRTDNDRIGEKAKLEKLEPMELVHKYTSIFHGLMAQLGNEEPSIEPTATGHIVEQIEMIKKIIAEGYAYEVNGSVYFDVKKYAESHDYGRLSGRVIEEQLETTRDLDGQEEKRNKADFALWKAAPPQHIQRWQSPWGEGFPGWHIECSAMAGKYLGTTFDIHGGGMDLQFPHHESEIAQSTIAHGGHAPVHYWMHNNMITINGKKMGRSYNNIIKLRELFSGDHPLLEQGYHPMGVRFNILQAHYRSTLDFSNKALQDSEKALQRLLDAYEVLKSTDFPQANSASKYFVGIMNDEEIEWGSEADLELIRSIEANDSRWESIDFLAKVEKAIEATKLPGMSEDEYFNYKTPYGQNHFIIQKCLECALFMNDDFNTAKVIGHLSELVRIINTWKEGLSNKSSLFAETISLLRRTFKLYVEDILGLQSMQESQTGHLYKVMDVLIDMRKAARARKDFPTSDAIRNQLAEAGIQLKDEKDGSMSWALL